MTTNARYKFANAHEWLGNYMQRIDDPERLRSIIRLFVVQCDDDTIQDMFQTEMDADGYFDEQETGR